MAFDIGEIGKWYQSEVGRNGDGEYNLEDADDRESASERTLFDINTLKRSSFAIGANWYYDAISASDDDHPSMNLCFNVDKGGSLLDQDFKSVSPPTKHMNLYKELPPIPVFENDDETAKTVTEAASEDNLKSLVGARINAVPFDYMFADADEAEVNSINDDDDSSLLPAEMVEDDGDVGLEDFGPSTPPQIVTHHHVHEQPQQAQAIVTHHRNHHISEQSQRAQSVDANQVLDLTGIDLSAVNTQIFHVAGIPITTTDVINNHVLALGTNFAAPLVVNEDHEADKAQVTDNFFNGPVEESPGPFHLPLLDGETGYGDIRDEDEDYPESWRHMEEIERKRKLKLKPISCEEAETLAPTTSNPTPLTIDTTNSTKAHHTETKPDLFGLADRAKARHAKKAAALASVDVVQKSPILIDLTVDENVCEPSSSTKKRRARSSFSTKSVADDDDEVQYLYTKKVRVNSEKDEDEAISALRPSTYSLITEADDNAFTDFDTVYNPALLPQLSGVTGFKGQFQGLATPEQAERAKKLNAQKVAVYTGQAHHLNNLILHKDMHVCPTFEDTEYTPASAPTNSDLARCISYAEDKTEEAAEMARIPAEEALRQEAHLECTMARLEGVVVGNYRYFQGHMTVEDYHERKMCVCWQLCECSKLCTRFADLICPCSDKIETNCH